MSPDSVSQIRAKLMDVREPGRGETVEFGRSFGVDGYNQTEPPCFGEGGI